MEDRSRLQVKTPAELYGLEGENPEVISRREVFDVVGRSPRLLRFSRLTLRSVLHGFRLRMT